MKIKIFISRTLKLLALLLPLVCLVWAAQEHAFYFEDYNTRRIERFYLEEENSLDAVIVGASETFTGFVPGYAYECYGFTSYLYSQDSNTGSIYKSIVKEIEKHQDPQVILVDIYGFLAGDGWEFYDEPRFRTYVESIPFSWNKVQTILEHPFEDKISYFVPYIKYHGEFDMARERWEINHNGKVYPDLKGIVTQTVIAQEDPDPGFDVNMDTYQLDEDSRKCLLDFLAYCEKENLDNIVFMNVPRYLDNENNNNSWLAMIARVEEILNENGYPLLNLQEQMEEIGLDVTRDFYNNHHLNIYGQMKLTDYLSAKLLNEYNLVPTEQSEENLQKWDQVVMDTRQYFEMADALIHQGKDEQIFETAYAWLNPGEILNAG